MSNEVMIVKFKVMITRNKIAFLSDEDTIVRLKSQLQEIKKMKLLLQD